jgi:hypothetical protein
MGLRLRLHAVACGRGGWACSWAAAAAESGSDGAAEGAAEGAVSSVQGAEAEAACKCGACIRLPHMQQHHALDSAPPCPPPAGFKELSESEGHRAPESKRGKDMEDSLLERSFWSRCGGRRLACWELRIRAIAAAALGRECRVPQSSPEPSSPSLTPSPPPPHFPPNRKQRDHQPALLRRRHPPVLLRRKAGLRLEPAPPGGAAVVS